MLFVYVTAWFRVQIGINSTSEWLLIARGEAECYYAIHELQVTSLHYVNTVYSKLLSLTSYKFTLC